MKEAEEYSLRRTKCEEGFEAFEGRLQNAEHSDKIMKSHQRGEKAKEDAALALDRVKQLEKEKKDLGARVKELEEKTEIVSKEKETALEGLKTKDTKIRNLQVQWIDRQEVEDKEVIIGSFRDEIQTILDAMKTVPMKDKKKVSFAQLTEQLKGDYDNLLREHREDFEHFKGRFLSDTETPSTSPRSSS
ncbi:hypothetical protein R1sor_016574 [Riccia sorocarpa]|uniref:Uncharacterized protein n=1 Tax=Riccia sorocarpa TaxID=122646 RepID=A0ABD3HIX5_9MARC